MKSFAWTWALSRSATIAGWAEQEALRHDEQGGDAGLAEQHRAAVVDHLDVVGAGSEPPAICPDLNSSTAAELGFVGLTKASPPPVVVVVTPFCLSQ